MRATARLLLSGIVLAGAAAPASLDYEGEAGPGCPDGAEWLVSPDATPPSCVLDGTVVVAAAGVWIEGCAGGATAVFHWTIAVTGASPEVGTRELPPHTCHVAQSSGELVGIACWSVEATLVPTDGLPMAVADRGCGLFAPLV